MQGATLHGRALAQTAVTLIGDIVTSANPAPVVIAPSVTTNTVSSVTSTTGTLNGAITSTGGSDATQSGFAYGTDPTLTAVIATSSLGAETGDASFIQSVASLSPSTTYYFRAYATNSAGTGLGAIQSFMTSAPVVVPTTAPVSNSGGGSGGGYSSGGSSPIYNSGSATPSTTTVTTTVTRRTSTPNASNVIPGLPNTGFPPEVTSNPWNTFLSKIYAVENFIQMVVARY